MGRLDYKIPLNLILGSYAFLIGINISLLMGDNVSRGIIDTLYSILLVFMFVVRRHYKLKELGIFIITVFTFLFAGYHTRRIFILTYALFLINAFHYSSFNKLVKAVIVGALSSRFVVILMTLIGVIPNLVLSRRGGDGYCLGYDYVWQVPYGVFFSFLSYFYLKGNNIKWSDIFISLIINHLLYLTCRVRLVYYLWYFSELLYILFIKLNIVKRFGNVITGVLILAFPVLFLAELYLGYNYNSTNPIITIINSFASGRLRLNYVALSTYPVTLLGQFIETSKASLTTQYFYLDSGYLYTLLGYGVILMTLVLIMYCYLTWYACSTNNKSMVIWLIMVMLFTVSNNGWIFFEFNCLLLAFPFALKKRLFPNGAATVDPQRQLRVP